MFRKSWILLTLIISAMNSAYGSDAVDDTLKQKKMIIEIWSDIACPFCYIGKTRFERALNKFEHKDQVQVIWRSFQLNPYLKTDTTITLYESLARQKGWTMQYTRQVSDQVTAMATADGLIMNFDHVMVANTYKAHVLLQIAGQFGVQSKVGDALFKAYFAEGKNIDDHSVLQSIAEFAGLNGEEVMKLLEDTRYAKMMEDDLRKAESLGIAGVPFFLFIQEYPVSGAQDENTFLNALQRGWSIHSKAKETSNKTKLQGEVCTPKSNCE